MGYNNIVDLPEEITLLSGLEELDLSHNTQLNLKTILPKLLKLKELQNLTLIGCSIETLPNSFWQLTSLKELTLFGNRIKSISSKIQSLTHLKVLYLMDNPIARNKKEQAQLKKLLPHTKIYYSPHQLYEDK
jgi:Leucine-rich repeat (LRR) protein